MKLKTKQITKLLKIVSTIVFSCITIILWNCQSDNESIEIVKHQDEFEKTSIVSYNELPNKIVYRITEVAPHSNLKRKQQLNNLILDENKIIKLVDSTKNTSYSIRFSLKNTPNNTFFNLVIQTSSNNNVKKPYILKYIIHNLEQLPQKDGIIDYSKMNATIERYSYSQFIKQLTTKQLKRGDTPCDRYSHSGSEGGGSPSGSSNIGGGASGSSNGGNSGPSGAGNNGTVKCRVYTYSTASTGIFAIKIYCDDGTVYSSRNEGDCGFDKTGGGVGINTPNYCPNGRIINGECVPIVDDKIDDSQLSGKAKCVYEKLTKNGNTFVKDILKKFQGNSEFDIKIVSKNKVFPKNVTTSDGINGKTRYVKGSSLINIEISTFKLSNMPALAAARTLIHEYIHADMYRKLHTKYPTQGDLDFKKTYLQFKKGNFKATLQHNSMADLYVHSIRDALKSFHKKVLVGDYNYLTNNGTNPLPDSFYEALAWQGLKDDNVKAYANLTNAKKTELTNALNAHYHSTTKNCPK